MSALDRLLGLAWARGLLGVHAAGISLLVLVHATEAANRGAGPLLPQLLREVPATWVLLAPALTLAGAALAVARLRQRGELLALATLGVPWWRVPGSAGLGAVPLALAAVGVAAGIAPANGVFRVAGGWVVAGRAVADPGAVVGAILTPGSDIFGLGGGGVLVVAAALVGAGLRSGGGVLLGAAAAVVLEGVRRGLDPAPAGWLVGTVVVIVLCASAFRRGR